MCHYTIRYQHLQCAFITYLINSALLLTCRRFAVPGSAGCGFYWRGLTPLSNFIHSLVLSIGNESILLAKEPHHAHLTDDAISQSHHPLLSAAFCLPIKLHLQHPIFHPSSQALV